MQGLRGFCSLYIALTKRGREEDTRIYSTKYDFHWKEHMQANSTEIQFAMNSKYFSIYLYYFNEDNLNK